MTHDERVEKSAAEWQRELSPEVYAVTRLKGTERPFSGKYFRHHEAGTYTCACCGAPLFSSRAKYDSACGWPSFTAPSGEERVALAPDTSHGMSRTEVTCRRCGAHLGHLFDDGPPPSGARYCINSASLGFVDD